MAKREAPKLVSKSVIDRFKQGLDTTKNQRDRERAALKFMDPKFQWDPAHIAAREGTSVAGSPIPARPMLSISKIEQPIQLVQNGFQNANLEIKVQPLSPGADKKTAEIFQGLIRQIARDSNAVIPRGWAFERASEAGFGCYRILTDFDETSDEATDLKILIKRIRYQEAVVFDPAANEPDYSDARYLFITSWMPVSSFKAEYPKASISVADDSVLAQLEKERPEWVDVDNEQKGILVAEYYDRRRNPETGQFDVWWYKVCAGPGEEIDTLDSEYWNGQYIPVIPVIGKELQPFDKERRYQGMVEPAMDAQRGFNYAITTALEIAALEPKAPFVGVEGSFAGHEPKWNTINTRNWPYVEHAIVIAENGTIMPPPARMQIDAGRLSVSLQLMAAFDQAIQAVTYTPDPALGKTRKNESGTAIEALQQQSVASTSNFMSNMTQISMMYEGKVLIDMIPRIYNNPGRIVRIVDVEDETEEVMLNQPFVTDPNTGRPTSNTSVQPNQKPQEYNLTKGKFGVSVSIGKSYSSRFEQGREDMTQLLGADPSLMGVLGDIFFKYNGAPWSPEAEKRMRKVIEAAHPDFFQPEQQGMETPEQLQAGLKASQAQIQQMTQIGEQMKQQLDTDAAKQQATIQKAQIDAQIEQAKIAADLRKAEMDNQTRIQVAEIAAGAKIDASKLDAVISLALDRSKEAQAAFDRRHERQLGHSEMSHDVAKTMMEHEQAQEMAQMGHEQGLEAAEQAAAMEPVEQADGAGE